MYIKGSSYYKSNVTQSFKNSKDFPGLPLMTLIFQSFGEKEEFRLLFHEIYFMSRQNRNNLNIIHKSQAHTCSLGGGGGGGEESSTEA